MSILIHALTLLLDRDFAYVARDRVTRRHMCHVFRCDTPARTIANTLRDICKKIMIERNLQHGFGKTTPESGNSSFHQFEFVVFNWILFHSYKVPIWRHRLLWLVALFRLLVVDRVTCHRNSDVTAAKSGKFSCRVRSSDLTKHEQ